MGNSKYTKCCIEYLKLLYTVDRLDDKLDANNNLLAFDDKVYDVLTNSYRDILPNDFITKTCKRNAPTVEYLDKQVFFKNILYSIFENSDVVEYWLKIIGVSLFTNKFDFFYILTGKGGNGKGLLFELLKNCIGEYFYQSENTFLSGITEAGQANPTLSNSKGVRVLSVSAPNNGSDTCALNCDFIKSMTGRDDITSRNLYQSNITYVPFFNVFLQCNDIPSIKKLDNGMTRRLRVINYPFQFVHHPINSTDRQVNIKLKDDFKHDEQLKDAFLQILFQYAYENINNNSIEQPELVKESVDNYLEDNNPIKLFLDERFEITKNKKDKFECSQFGKSYLSYGSSDKLSPSKIVKDMAFNGFDVCKTNGTKYYIGLVIKEISDDVSNVDDVLSVDNVFDVNPLDAF